MRARASCPTPTNASSHHIWGPGHLAPLPLMPHPTTLPGQYSSAWGSTNLTGQALHAQTKYWMNWWIIDWVENQPYRSSLLVKRPRSGLLILHITWATLGPKWCQWDPIGPSLVPFWIPGGPDLAQQWLPTAKHWCYWEPTFSQTLWELLTTVVRSQSSKPGTKLSQTISQMPPKGRRFLSAQICMPHMCVCVCMCHMSYVYMYITYIYIYVCARTWLGFYRP